MDSTQNQKERNRRVSQIDLFFRATNYLSIGQIYLKDNPLLRGTLRADHCKVRLLGHWGTSPGINLIYAHLNRLIQDTGARVLFVVGPGHGGPAVRANLFLEGSLEKIHPELSLDCEGMRHLMRYFSWPQGTSSHVSPSNPGSIHEGGELGYSLAHAFGAVFDHPHLISVCVVGDGEAETGPLAASWHSNKFIHPGRDGAVLPILHLNGYKISGPTIFGRMSNPSIESFFKGCGYQPIFVEGSDPLSVHQLLWEGLDESYRKIRAIQQEAMDRGATVVEDWPLIILRTPKGWTGPKILDGKQIEGNFLSHQVPIGKVVENEEHRDLLLQWLRSYRPEELFREDGSPMPEILSLLPPAELRMGGLPEANGGLLLQALDLPDMSNYALDVIKHGKDKGESTRVFGRYLRGVFEKNPHNFRLFCPDETSSNRLDDVFKETGRVYLGETLPSDEFLASDGRVMEILSEHLCQGWLEGYLLTGRHGLFPCYEAFALIVDSMVNQHGKWLKLCQEIPWRKPIASLNYLLTSHAWRQDHNGYSHQGPGFIESIMQKKSSIARVYLPPDGNCLLCVGDHCLRTKNYINLIIAGKQPMPQWLSIDEAKLHCAQGASIWEWAGTSQKSPEVIMVSSGDVPTLETLAAIHLLREAFPRLNIRMINVVSLFSLTPNVLHPHGLDEQLFTDLFTQDRPVIFAFHGHPSVIGELIFHRPSPHRFHVHGYIEEGTTTTPFDMVVCNQMSRFHLAMSAVQHLPQLRGERKSFLQRCQQKLAEHKQYIYEHGIDQPEIREWKWSS